MPDGFTVFDPGLTEAQRKRLRTSNGVESLNQQIKRRTGAVARPISNEAPLLRLVSAVLLGTREERETERQHPPRKED